MQTKLLGRESVPFLHVVLVAPSEIVKCKPVLHFFQGQALVNKCAAVSTGCSYCVCVALQLHWQTPSTEVGGQSCCLCCNETVEVHMRPRQGPQLCATHGVGQV